MPVVDEIDRGPSKDLRRIREIEPSFGKRSRPFFRVVMDLHPAKSFALSAGSASLLDRAELM